MRPINTFISRLLLVCLVLLLSFFKGSAQGFIWARQVGIGGCTVAAFTLDGNNNSYFVGTFSGTVDFDPGPGVQNLTAGGYSDVFILKQDAAGNLLWVKQIEGANAVVSACYGSGIGLDDLGNVYIGGYYRDSFDFDPGPGVHLLGAYSSGNYYSYNNYVLKLSPLGNYIWAKSIGSQTTVIGMFMRGMEIDAAANIFFVCGFGSDIPVTIDVDPGSDVHNIQCQTGGNFLIEKLDSAGNFIWAKTILGPNISGEGPYIRAFTIDTLSNIYVTGVLTGSADFDPGMGVANFSGSIDVFIAKYDSAGNYQWAGAINGGWWDESYDITTDAYGNVIVTGEIDYGSADADLGTGVHYLSEGMFVLKLRSDGNFAWGKSFLSYGGITVATDGLGNVYTNGLQKMDSAGNLVWAKSFENAYAMPITVDHANDVYVAGEYGAFNDLDPGPGQFSLSGGGSFIAKLCGTSLPLTATNDTICPLGDSAQLSAPAITGATYTWTLNDNFIATGSSNTLTVGVNGIYEVYVNGGCPSASGQLYIYDCYGSYQTHIVETMKAEGIEAYPNPFEDVLTVKGLKVNDQLSLIDITGSLVYKWKSTTPTQAFITTDLVPGYYVLKIVNEHGMVRVNVPVVKR